MNINARHPEWYQTRSGLSVIRLHMCPDWVDPEIRLQAYVIAEDGSHENLWLCPDGRTWTNEEWGGDIILRPGCPPAKRKAKRARKWKA